MNTNQLVKLFCTLLSAPLLTLALTTSVQAGQVYKWVDDQGVTHYEERAPANKDYSLVKTYGEVPSDHKEAEQRLEQQRIEKKMTTEKDADYAAQKKIADEQVKVRMENCKSAQNNLKTIQENARVRVLGEDGEFHYLSEEERQSEINKAQEMIKENCNS